MQKRLTNRPTIPSSEAPSLYRFHQERYNQCLKDEDLTLANGWLRLKENSTIRVIREFSHSDSVKA